MSPGIASLFSGTGALDIAVQTVFGGDVVWHCQYEPPDKNGKEDKNQYAAKILARHWPDVPNLGDVTKVDWPSVIEEHGPVNILTGGFPCQDVSTAGKRAGLTSDSRSGLWTHMARAIHDLNPELVIIENVEGLLSSKAARGMESGAETLDQHPGTGGILRALGAVLGDLATLGFHAEWQVVAASAIGAPHRRKRIIIYAWKAPQNADSATGRERRIPAPRQAQERGARTDTGRRGGTSAPDAGGIEPERWGIAEVLGSPETAQPGQGDQRERAGDTTRNRGEVAADPDGRRRDRNQERDRGQDQSGLAAPSRLDAVGRGFQRAAAADADLIGRRADLLNLRPGQPDVDWGDYGPAIRRWERILGRRAPWPTDALGRLSPVFSEWLMGLPDGWVTCTPGLTKAAMHRAIGNGVVPQQVIAALPMLHARAISEPADPAAAA